MSAAPGGLYPAPITPSRQLSLAQAQGADMQPPPNETADRANRTGDTSASGDEDDKLPLGAASPLASIVMSAWQENYRARAASIDNRLLACLQARRAQYAPDELALFSQNGAPAPYMPISALKMRTAEAAIGELLLPPGEQAWGFHPSTDPSLPEHVLSQIATAAAHAAQLAMQQPGAATDPASFQQTLDKLREQLQSSSLAKLKERATEAAHALENAVGVHLATGNYKCALRAFVNHLCTFPTAILKGPYVRPVYRARWDGDKVVREKVPTLWWDAVSPFDVYPAPQSASVSDGAFIERVRMTKEEFSALQDADGYDRKAIRNLIALGDQGNLGTWLSTEMERRSIEGETGYTIRPEFAVDGLHYWGSVQGTVLRQHGVKVPDPFRYYEVDALLVSNSIVRVKVHPDGVERPYYIASFDPVPGAFWGNSIYELMADAQGMVNASVRALNINLGLGAGPIVGFDISKFAVGENPKTLAPLTCFQLDMSRASNQDASNAIVFYQADDRLPSLSAIIERFYQMADDLTGIPRYLYSQPDGAGAVGTASGLSMLMGSALKGLRKVVYSIDQNVVRPTLKAAALWEMEHGGNVRAMGDIDVVPRGSMEIIARESLLQGSVNFLQMTSNPTDMSLLGMKRRAKLLAQVAHLMDIDLPDFPPSDQEMQNAARAAQSSAQKPSPDVEMQTQAKLHVAQLAAEERWREALIKTQSHERQQGAKLMARELEREQPE